MKETIKISVSIQGVPVASKHGYDVKRGENVCSFFVDGRGDTGRIYPVTTCSSVSMQSPNGDFTVVKFPSIYLEDGGDKLLAGTEIYFPEFEGWNVHSAVGGKTMAVCLTKY